MGHRRRYHGRGLRFLLKLEKCVDRGNLNCQQHDVATPAELASIDNGASRQVQAIYDEAIRIVFRMGTKRGLD
jgi:hypothetical protein